VVETIGDRDWCIWCKGTDMTDLREVSYATKNEEVSMFVCSEACEGRLRDFFALVDRRRPLFIGLAIGWLVVTVLAIVLAITVYKHLLHLASLAMVGFGVALWFMPFVTPQTIEMMGVKRGTLVGRISAIVLIAMGIGTSVLFILFPPKG
jgi:hypothetical protein